MKLFEVDSDLTRRQAGPNCEHLQDVLRRTEMDLFNSYKHRGLGINEHRYRVTQHYLLGQPDVKTT